MQPVVGFNPVSVSFAVGVRKLPLPPLNISCDACFSFLTFASICVFGWVSLWQTMMVFIATQVFFPWFVSYCRKLMFVLDSNTMSIFQLTFLHPPVRATVGEVRYSIEIDVGGE